MANPAHPFMPTRAEGRDPNLCAAKDCGKVWNSIDHQPSRYLAELGPYRAAVAEAVEKLSQGAGVPPDLLRQERASGPPSGAATNPAPVHEIPADGYMPRGFAMLHGIDTTRLVPADARTIMCPMSGTDTLVQCKYAGSRLREDVYKHMKHDHGYDEKYVGEYLRDPWFGDEARETWKARTFWQRYGPINFRTADGKEGTLSPDEAKAAFMTIGEPGRGKTVMNPALSMYAEAMRQAMEAESARKIAEVQDSEIWQIPADPQAAQDALAKLGRMTQPEPAEYCDHPNGFGPNGCPCGAIREGEDEEPTFRNLDTNEDERAIRCPECINPESVWPTSRIQRHLQDPDPGHGWTDAMWEDWAEEHGLSSYPREELDHPTDSPIWGHAVNCPECELAFLKSSVRRHLQTTHQWTGDMWADWAESINFLELPLVPDAVNRFFDPDVTMEEIMGHAAPDDPHAAMRAELTDWWIELAEQEADKVVPKAVEYGALDLIQIGQDLALAAGREVTDEEAAEMGVYFYLRGKLARWTDAIIRHDRPSDDTLHDIGVYVRMAQRIRVKGSWPGTGQN